MLRGFALLGGRRAEHPGRTAFYLLLKGTLFTSGYFTEVLGSYLLVAVAGYAISIPTVLTGLFHARQLGFTKAAVDEWVMVPCCFEAAPGALANAALVLLLSRRRWLEPESAGLGAAGRHGVQQPHPDNLVCQFVFAWGPWKL